MGGVHTALAANVAATLKHRHCAASAHVASHFLRIDTQAFLHRRKPLMNTATATSTGTSAGNRWQAGDSCSTRRCSCGAVCANN